MLELVFFARLIRVILITLGEPEEHHSAAPLISAPFVKGQSPTDSATEPPAPRFLVLHPPTKELVPGKTHAVLNTSSLSPSNSQYSLKSRDKGQHRRHLLLGCSLSEITPAATSRAVNAIQLSVPASPPISKRPLNKVQKKLTVNLGGTEFNRDKEQRTSLSPLTGAATLRRMMSPTFQRRQSLAQYLGRSWGEIGKCG